MGKLLGAWNYLMERMTEPSTHASLAALTAMAGYSLDTGVLHDGIVSVGLIFGMLGFFVKEVKSGE